MTPVEQLERSLDDTRTLVEAVRDDQWDLPTPCAEWSVRDLVDHLTAGNRLFARALLGDPSSTASGPDGIPSPSTPAAYRDSAAALLAAFSAPGVMERVVTVPFGAVPGVVALHLRLVESLVHGWDLARATGQSPECDEEVAEQELRFTQQKLADVPPDRSPFGPAQPVDAEAPALDRLAACLGRDVDAPIA
ncbi:MAG: TIGR03086 family metal-binding protein [Mycobacteriales bacterium]